MITQAWLDALPFGILITDVELRLVQVNRWLAARLPEVTARLGQPMADVLPELAERSLMAAFELTLSETRETALPQSLFDHFVRLPAEPGAGFACMPQSATIAPLWEGGSIIGTLTVIEDVTQRVLTERQLEREIDKMTALHEVDRALATLELTDCLQIIVDRTRSLFAAAVAALFLIDGDRLVAAAVAGGDQTGLGQSLPMGQGLVGWAAAQREPVLAPDVRRDGRYFAYDAASRSEMAAPLLLAGGCLGVINVESSRVGAFNAQSLETLESLSARAATAIHNARLHAAEREQRTLADNLRNIGFELAGELDPDAILDTLLEHVARVVPYDSASVMILDPATGRIRIARQRGYDQFGVAHLAPQFEVPLSDIRNLALLARDQRPQVVADTLNDPDWRPGPLSAHIRSWAGAPIMARGQVLGLLSLDKTEPGFYTLDMAERLAAFAVQAGLALENARLYAAQQRLATTDSLTGLANRRHFDQELARELLRAGRFNRCTGLIMMDLDDFKSFNDQYGHPAGDDVLRALADLLRQHVRSIDTLARYGGEEFVLILPECDQAAACSTADRLRELVAGLPLQMAAWAERAAPERVTISLGVALAPQHATAAAALVQAADVALYNAKRAGKNRANLFQSQPLEMGSNPIQGQ